MNHRQSGFRHTDPNTLGLSHTLELELSCAWRRQSAHHGRSWSNPVAASHCLTTSLSLDTPRDLTKLEEIRVWEQRKHFSPSLPPPSALLPEATPQKTLMCVSQNSVRLQMTGNPTYGWFKGEINV